jgi:hypothetical protein
VRYRDIPVDQSREEAALWKPFTLPTEASSGRHRLDLAILSVFGAARGRRSPSVSTPIRRVVWRHAVGQLIADHDVSGTGWQTLGRAMQSITTMVPVWQCGHARNDWPVSASNRSR